MEKYLLLSEQKRINKLLEQLEKQLYQNNINEIEKILYKIISNNKDTNIEDTIIYFTNLLSLELKSLLDNHLTQGLQFGIKNNSIEINSYSGTYHYNTTQDINEETLFSLDSISKVITSTITMLQARNNNYTLNSTINSINKEYNLDATIESILKFTAQIKTNKRLENLNTEETIKLLKECKENITEKQKYINFFEYNDIGYMILRQTIPNFIETLNNLTNPNITYNNQTTTNITGGRKSEENITPDKKGRTIIYPGHTGMYANITGLLNFFYTLLYTENILTTEEKTTLLKQPYNNPIRYSIDKTPKIENNNYKYINKIAGFYKLPKGITQTYNKLFSFDMPNNTTNNSIATAGTCGSWLIGDSLTLNNKQKNYVASLLTNPYSFVETKEYPNNINYLDNTPLKVNSKGKIIEYSRILNPYKETLVTYSIILELLTEYMNIDSGKNIKIKKKSN